MALGQETRQLTAERDRLDSALDELAETIAEAEAPDAFHQEAQEVEARLRGVEYLIETHGEDGTVTLRGLSSGSYGRVEDRVQEMREQRNARQLPGARRNVFAAIGLVDAPFFDFAPPQDLTKFNHEEFSSESEWTDAKLEAVANQPIGVAKYIEGVVNDLTTVDEGNSKSLRQRLLDKQQADA